MKKQHVITTLALLLSTTAFAQQTYKVQVQLTKPALPAKAYLVKALGWSNQQVLDSADVNAGKVAFTGPVTDPQKVSIALMYPPFKAFSATDGYHSDAVTFYLEPGNVTITAADSLKYAKVKGGKYNQQYATYEKEVTAPFDLRLKNLDRQFRAAMAANPKDTSQVKPFMTKIRELGRQRDSMRDVFISKHPDSYMSLEALIESAGKLPNLTALEARFKKFTPAVKNTAAGKKLADVIYDKKTGIGAIAPDFTQNDVNGKPVKLSDFRGSYVLLDFWASWCGPCRAENPNVLKNYNQFKDKNFTVVGVSLDESADKWKEAIAHDNMPWLELSDLKGWANAAAKLYGVQAIPQNVLIDPSGKIVGKNLRGDALQEELAKILH